jgi:hypothetical protein
MKHLLLLIVLLPTICKAQTSRGSLLTGGDISFASQRQNTTLSFFSVGDIIEEDVAIKTNCALLSPTIGYFLIDNLCLGLSFPMSFSKSTAKIQDDIYFRYESTTRVLTFGPFLRYYFSLHDKISLIASTGYAWGYNRTRTGYLRSTGSVTEQANSESKFHSRTYTIGTGVSFFPNRNTGVEFLIEYGKLKYDEISTDTNSLTAAIGLQLYFAK